MNQIWRVAHGTGVVLVCSVMLITALGGQVTPLATIQGWVSPNRGVGPEPAGSVIWIDDVPGEFPPPKAHAVLDQKNMRFVPHILPILVGTTAEFPNSDPFLHNVFSISPAKPFNLGLYPRGRVPTVTFDKPGVVTILCNVHPEMSAYIIVLKNPFFAIPAPDGSFLIRNVPAGNRIVRYWSEDGKSEERAVTLVPGALQGIDFRRKIDR